MKIQHRMSLVRRVYPSEDNTRRSSYAGRHLTDCQVRILHELAQLYEVANSVITFGSVAGAQWPVIQSAAGIDAPPASAPQSPVPLGVRRSRGDRRLPPRPAPGLVPARHPLVLPEPRRRLVRRPGAARLRHRPAVRGAQRGRGAAVVALPAVRNISPSPTAGSRCACCATAAESGRPTVATTPTSSTCARCCRWCSTRASTTGTTPSNWRSRSRRRCAASRGCRAADRCCWTRPG